VSNPCKNEIGRPAPDGRGQQDDGRPGNHIDDLCLDTTASLLYCVRTGSDIMFERELAQMQSRMANFRYRYRGIGI
jgi:hypothetical protein